MRCQRSITRASGECGMVLCMRKPVGRAMLLFVADSSPLATPGMRLYDTKGYRLYLTSSERAAFRKAAEKALTAAPPLLAARVCCPSPCAKHVW
jgi:hypothetical protein